MDQDKSGKILLCASYMNAAGNTVVTGGATLRTSTATGRPMKAMTVAMMAVMTLSDALLFHASHKTKLAAATITTPSEITSTASFIVWPPQGDADFVAHVPPQLPGPR